MTDTAAKGPQAKRSAKPNGARVEAGPTAPKATRQPKPAAPRHGDGAAREAAQMPPLAEAAAGRAPAAAPPEETIEAYQIRDPQQLARNLVRLFEEGAKVMAEALKKSQDAGGAYGVLDNAGEASRVFGAVARQWAGDPARMFAAQGRLMQGYAELWTRSMRRFLGEDVEPVIEPDAGDPRFKDRDWSQHPYFDFLKQAYLLTSRWAQDLVAETEGLDERTRQRAAFYTALIASALSPSNFAATNPEVLRETLSSNAENLVRGLEQLERDLKQSKDLLRIPQTDLEAFEVGRNLAITPGKVVFQNELVQLIQYAPSTDTVYEIPLLIVPPWINKYYILDLVPQKSFVRWAVAQGFTVFVISWVNPDERHAHKTFEDYMREGILACTEAVLEATGAPQINALGYCVGGTLLACTLAYMAAKGDERIRSATFLAAQVDFKHAGDLLVFIDEQQLKALAEMMSEQGYLEGSRMAAVFNLLRPRDLIWPYLVNSYLLGKKPLPFDLLFWNSDSTRMPAENHKFYLTEFYHLNKLAKGELMLGGVRLDLSKVKIPIYELATREDHIAPAKSVFVGAKLFGGPVRFVVAGSGHIAGVVNPPDRQKYQYWTDGDVHLPALEAWLARAEEHPGSWWPDWAAWLAAQSGERSVPAAAREPGKGKLKAIEDAPGSYVRVKSG